MLLLLYPQVCYPIVFFSIFLGKIHWPLLFGSSSNCFLKTRIMFFSSVFLMCSSLTPCPLRGYCWCSGMNSVRLQWNAEDWYLLPVIFGKVCEGVWSLYLCNHCLTALIFPPLPLPAREIIISLEQNKICRVCFFFFHSLQFFHYVLILF